MNPTPSPKPAFRVRKRYVLLLVVLSVPVFCAVAVAGYLRLGSETSALRGSVMGSVKGPWKKRFAVSVGWLTTALVRTGSRFVQLPPEPRAALETLRAADVGVYQLQRGAANVDSSAIFNAADKAMNARGCVRVVGVVKDHDLVAVYTPRKRGSGSTLRCSVLVLHDQDLVVVSASGNLKPLLALAGERLNSNPEWKDFWQGR